MIGNRVVVDFADRAFLRAHATSEVAEVIDRQRQVGMRRLPDRLAVVEGFDQRQHVEIGLDDVGDSVQHLRALGGRRPAPGILRLVGGVQRQFDVFRGAARDLADRLAGDGRDVVEILAAHWGDPLAADEVIVP